MLVRLEDEFDDVLEPEDLEGLTEEEIQMELEYAEELANSPQYWFTPDKIERIKQVHDYLDDLPAIGKVLSLASPIRVAEDYNGDELDGFQLALLYTQIPTRGEEPVSSILMSPSTMTRLASWLGCWTPRKIYDARSCWKPCIVTWWKSSASSQKTSR